MGGVILRPWRLPEAIWTGVGAPSPVAFPLIPWADALSAAAEGANVYSFLSGMMLLAGLARKEGLFNWLAARAARRAQGSAHRQFLFVYGVGTLVTVFLSNDATAVF
jgi:arsenical pump membrane protein